MGRSLAVGGAVGVGEGATHWLAGLASQVDVDVRLSEVGRVSRGWKDGIVLVQYHVGWLIEN